MDKVVKHNYSCVWLLYPPFIHLKCLIVGAVIWQCSSDRVTKISIREARFMDFLTMFFIKNTHSDTYRLTESVTEPCSVSGFRRDINEILAFYYDFMQRRSVVSDRRFGTTYLYHFLMSSNPNPRKAKISWFRIDCRTFCQFKLGVVYWFPESFIETLSLLKLSTVFKICNSNPKYLLRK